MTENYFPSENNDRKLFFLLNLVYLKFLCSYEHDIVHYIYYKAFPSLYKMLVYFDNETSHDYSL